jgi:DNA polymerase V
MMLQLVPLTSPLPPFYLSGVAGAGFPSPAQDWEETRIDLVDWLAPDRASCFLFRVDGNSMRDAGIVDGDIIVIDRALKPKAGMIVVARFEDGFVCRQAVRRDGAIWLEGRNALMSTAPILADESVEVFGVVRAMARKLGG